MNEYEQTLLQIRAMLAESNQYLADPDMHISHAMEIIELLESGIMGKYDAITAAYKIGFLDAKGGGSDE